MKRKMNVAGMLVVSCLLFMTSCQQTQPVAPAAEFKTMTVETTHRVLPTTYSASIRGCQDIDIYPQVGGTLQRLCVSEGQRVRKGQILFVIDQVPFQAALATAQANLKAAEAALATAQLTLASKQNLFNQKIVSSFDLQQAKNAVQSAQAVVLQAKAQVTNASNNLSYTEVKAPADGVVGTLPYRQGALVGSSLPQPLTVVSDNSTMYVYFSMPENKLLTLTRQYGSPEKAIQEMPDAHLILSDGSTYELTGRVESISGVVDRSTGSVLLRAAFSNPSHLLHSGASGSIVLPTNYNNCIVVPQAATVARQNRISVFKVVEGKAAETGIKVSPINNGTEYIVTEGLQVGDEIIADGAGLVREGMPIKKVENM